MSTFSNVHLALQALLTHQQALNVTEHNVANASTPAIAARRRFYAPGLFRVLRVYRGRFMVVWLAQA